MNNWYFDTLPAHRRLKPGESLTGYLIWLVIHNGIKSLKGLSALCFNAQSSRIVSNLADYPPLSVRELSRATACSEEKLLTTTFYYLGQKFGRSTHPQAVSRFLNGSIASYLRYCPACLAENCYYRLVWRFLMLTGCPNHTCHLLNQCGYCGKELPIFGIGLRLGICPFCDKDLATCSTKSLSQVEIERNLARCHDLEFLLFSETFETISNDTAQSLGRGLEALRQTQQMTRVELAEIIQVRRGRIIGMELGDVARGMGNFKDYIKYIDYFGVTLRDILKSQVSPEELQLLKQTILESASVKKPIKKPIRSCKETSRQEQRTKREAELVETVLKAIDYLNTQQVRLTQHSISKIVGLTPQGLVKYPQIKKLFEEILRERIRKAQDLLIEEIQRAKDYLYTHDRPITKKAISEIIGVTPKVLRRNHQTRIILKEITKEYRHKQHYEELRNLTQRVEQSIATLEAQGQPITIKNISRATGILQNKLRKYSEIRDLTKRVREESSHNQEEELIYNVQEALEKLKVQNLNVYSCFITLDSVAEIVGISQNTLKMRSQVRALVKRAVEEYYQDRDKRVACEIQQALERLKSLGRSPTHKNISEITGIPISILNDKQIRVTVKKAAEEYRRKRKEKLQVSDTVTDKS